MRIVRLLSSLIFRKNLVKTVNDLVDCVSINFIV